MRIEHVTANKGALCAAILKTLPHWFGMAESNAAYERDVETMTMFAAIRDGAPFGFLALNRTTPHAFEIHVMGVVPARHRGGAGRALVEQAARFATGEGARVLTVKTLSARDPDPGYAQTRAFYAATGFFAIDEFPELWSPENLAVMMIRILE